MTKLNNSKETIEYLEICKKFCEIITSVKAQILFDIPDELSSLIKKDKLINETNNSIIINNNEGKNNNKINDFNIKSILAQFKLKLFNLSSNISELNINFTVYNLSLHFIFIKIWYCILYFIIKIISSSFIINYFFFFNKSPS